MYKSNLIRIISIFDDKTFEKFGKFVSSPYFNTNAKLIELYDILKEHYIQVNVLELSNEYLFEKLYGNKKYVEGTMYYLISSMESLAEEFIGIEKRDDIMNDLNILKEFKNNGLSSLFKKKFKLTTKKLKNIEDEDNLYHYLLANINRELVVREKELLTKKDLYKKEWIKPVDELLKFFLKAGLSNVNIMMSYKKVINDKIEVPLLDEIIRLAEKEKKYLKDMSSQTALLQLKILLHDDKNSYLLLKEILNNKSKGLSKKIIEGIIICLQIYCTARLLEGEDIRKQEFEIAKLRMKHELFLTENRMHIDAFFKIVMLAVSVSEFEWAKQFQNKYIKYVDERHRDNALHYGNARFYYQDKEYEKALKELGKIKNYSFIHYKPAVKILQMMIYYDLKFISEAHDLSNSFVQFLRNDKVITSNIKKAYFNFIKIYTKLLNADKTTKIDSLKSILINQKELLIARTWIIERLDEQEYKLTGKKSKAI